LGGAVAQYFAVHAPDRVTRIALISSVGFDAWPRWRTRVARTLIGVAKHCPAALLAGEAHATLLRGFVDRDEGRRSLDQFLRPFVSSAGRDALLAHLAAQVSDETAQLPLGEVRVPTAIVHGARDPFVSVSIAGRLQAAIPQSTLELIPDGSHFLPLNAPDRVAACIGTLLAR
jgi:pimeloyl-ACP methyl ester carboxylesterase